MTGLPPNGVWLLCMESLWPKRKSILSAQQDYIPINAARGFLFKVEVVPQGYAHDDLCNDPCDDARDPLQ